MFSKRDEPSYIPYRFRVVSQKWFPFRDCPNGLTWSADDKKLIYSLGMEPHCQLGEVTVANGSVKRLAFGASAALPTVSPRGDKLAFSSLSISENIWRRDLLHPESPAVELIPSSRAQFDAQYSPDGKRIAFASVRSGVQGVWISNEDGSNLVQISNPDYVSGSPQWSPDGNKIAFDSLPLDRWEIYVADVTERKPRKLVTNISGVIRPHWSRDGKWIYFSPRTWQNGSLSLSRLRRRCRCTLQRYRWDQSAGVFRWEDSIFCKPRRQFDAEKVALPGQPGTESEVDGLPRLRAPSFGPSLQAVSILFLPMRPDLSATLISPASRYGQSLKWTRISVAACRSLPMAAGSSIRKMAM